MVNIEQVYAEYLKEKNVENRNWNIKNAIEWRKFLSGVT